MKVPLLRLIRKYLQAGVMINVVIVMTHSPTRFDST
ncbi:hypothetical protein J2S06_002322 [Bacillus alveayuensis]|uniref:Uncharacterized protein n=1 Tax=Aeribacillus alveayuensis TaxID=279215 RepID=A0ABT9VQH4_9BACI|nr:hypothetical protein [Bacillus alveayuensis]